MSNLSKIARMAAAALAFTLASAGRAQQVPLQDLWGRPGAGLRERLLDAATPHDALDVLEGVLLGYLTGAPDPLVTAATGALSVGVPVGEVAEALGLEKGASVVRLDAIARFEDKLIGFLSIYFPMEIGSQLERADLEGTSPIIRLVERKLNIRIVRAEQLIEPDRAGRTAARYLDIDAEAPVLRVTRVYYTSFDRPVEVALIRYHPKRYRYAIDFRSDGARR